MSFEKIDVTPESINEFFNEIDMDQVIQNIDFALKWQTMCDALNYLREQEERGDNNV